MLRRTVFSISKSNFFYNGINIKVNNCHLNIVANKQLLIPSKGINWSHGRFCSSNTSSGIFGKIFSGGDSAPSSVPVEYIPPPPPPPTDFFDSSIILNALGEPTLKSIGLASNWTPVGWIQNFLEFIHVQAGLPWWAAIGCCTLVIRFCLFPLVIETQKNNKRMARVMPMMKETQEKITLANSVGNDYEAAKLGMELQEKMKAENFSFAKVMGLPFIQAPIFLSVFWALRKCANLPVESMSIGGCLWFTNLTIPDPTWGLSLITAATLLAIIEVGSESLSTKNVSSNVMKYVMRSFPIFVFVFSIKFPAAILCYWTTANFMSLGQVLFLKIPAVRDYVGLNITTPEVKKEAVKQIKKTSMIDSIKDSWKNTKITSEVANRYQSDAMKFRNAGMGDVEKTYKYNPLEKKKLLAKIKKKAEN